MNVSNIIFYLTAIMGKKGKFLVVFELAHTGTIFLSEVGDMRQDTQITMLRVLQERRFERLGGSDSLHVDVQND